MHPTHTAIFQHSSQAERDKVDLLLLDFHEGHKKMLMNLDQANVPRSGAVEIPLVLGAHEHPARVSSWVRSEVVIGSSEEIPAYQLEAGNRVANALQRWGEKVGSQIEETPQRVLPVLNGKTVRNDRSLPETLTASDLLEIYPYNHPAQIRRARWRDVVGLFTELSGEYEIRDQLRSPILPSNVKSLDYEGLHFVDGRIEPVAPESELLVALEPWTASNGYRLSFVETFLENSEMVAQKLFREILLRFAPSAFGTSYHKDHLRCYLGGRWVTRDLA
jgi:hypothetical protein